MNTKIIIAILVIGLLTSLWFNFDNKAKEPEEAGIIQGYKNQGVKEMWDIILQKLDQDQQPVAITINQDDGTQRNVVIGEIK